MLYTPKARQQMIAQLTGATVERVEYVEASEEAGPNPYWVVEFAEGFEISIRFMTEIHDALPPGR